MLELNLSTGVLTFRGNCALCPSQNALPLVTRGGPVNVAPIRQTSGTRASDLHRPSHDGHIDEYRMPRASHGKYSSHA